MKRLKSANATTGSNSLGVAKHSVSCLVLVLAVSRLPWTASPTATANIKTPSIASRNGSITAPEPALCTMPIYLAHGFRWPRPSIRQFVVIHNIDDAAPEYIVSPQTSAALRAALTNHYPSIMRQLPHLRFLEQYNPDVRGGDAVSQPYAFVADRVETCELSLDVTEALGHGVENGPWDALLDLKEQLAPKAKLGWYVVVNADEVRQFDAVQGDEVSRRCIPRWYMERAADCHAPRS